MRRSAPALLLAISLAPAAGCDGPRPADDASPGLRSTPPASETARFDPARVAVGDTVGGLVVTAVDVHPMAGEPGIWVGTVRFDGRLELQGVYQPHFDAPEVDALCFHPDAASADRLPRFAPDARSAPTRKRWFCFADAESARRAMPSPGTPREARVVVDGYTARRYFTDAWDEAVLVRVEAVGRERESTLRDVQPQPAVSISDG